MSFIAAMRRAAGIVAALATAALLSGCLVTSETNLVPLDEAVALGNSDIDLRTYTESGDAFALSEESPGVFTLQADNGYRDSEDTMTAYFTPFDDNRYVMSLVAADGIMYGLVRIEDGILEIRMVLAGGTSAEVAAAGRTLPDSVQLQDSGAVILDRAGLDAVLALIADGTITTTPLLAWIADGEAPATLVAADGWYRAGA